MLSVKLYRHKVEKDVYLIRNWGLCGGGPDGDYYKSTTDPIEAIKNTSAEVGTKEGFEHWFSAFNGKLYVTHIQKREMQFDGFSGTLTKEVKLYVRDFEKVILMEV